MAVGDSDTIHNSSRFGVLKPMIQYYFTVTHDCIVCAKTTTKLFFNLNPQPMKESTVLYKLFCCT